MEMCWGCEVLWALSAFDGSVRWKGVRSGSWVTSTPATWWVVPERLWVKQSQVHPTC